MEIVRANLVVARVVVGVGLLLESLHGDVCPQLLPASSGQRRRRRRVTPGIAASCFLDRAKSCTDRAAVVAVQPRRDAETSRRCRCLIPRSTRPTLRRLLMNSPAEMSSAIESAICAVTSDVRNRAAPRAADELSGIVAQRRHEIGTRALQRREDPEQQAGDERQRRRERRSRSLLSANSQRPRDVARQQRHRSPSSVHVRHGRCSRCRRATARSTDSVSSCAISCGASRRARGAPPSPSCDWRRARAADWRCSRRRSAARSPVIENSSISGVRVSLVQRALALARRRSTSDLLRPELRHRLRAHALLQRRFDVVDDRRDRRR